MRVRGEDRRAAVAGIDGPVDEKLPNLAQRSRRVGCNAPAPQHGEDAARARKDFGETRERDIRAGSGRSAARAERALIEREREESDHARRQRQIECGDVALRMHDVEGAMLALRLQL